MPHSFSDLDDSTAEWDNSFDSEKSIDSNLGISSNVSQSQLINTPIFLPVASKPTGPIKDLSMQTVFSVDSPPVQKGSNFSGSASTQSPWIPAEESVSTPAPGRISKFPPFYLSQNMLSTGSSLFTGSSPSSVDSITPKKSGSQQGVDLACIKVSNPRERPQSADEMLRLLDHPISPGIDFKNFIELFTICGACNNVFTHISYYNHRCEGLKSSSSSQAESILSSSPAYSVKSTDMFHKVTKSSLNVTPLKDKRKVSFLRDWGHDPLFHVNSALECGGISSDEFLGLFTKCGDCGLVMTRNSWKITHAPKKCNTLSYPWQDDFL